VSESCHVARVSLTGRDTRAKRHVNASSHVVHVSLESCHVAHGSLTCATRLMCDTNESCHVAHALTCVPHMCPSSLTWDTCEGPM